MFDYCKAVGLCLCKALRGRRICLLSPLPTPICVQHGTPRVQVILVANKCDLPKETWAVSEEDAEKFAEDHGLKLFFASAKTGVKVEESFLWLVQMIYDKYKDTKE